MIGTVRFHRYPVLLSRAPARHGDPLSPPQSIGPHLGSNDPPTIPNNAAPDHDPAIVPLRRHRPSRDHPPRNRASGVKSP
jgi:hypothetical protein